MGGPLHDEGYYSYEGEGAGSVADSITHALTNTLPNFAKFV
jgi:hypothetical protein